MGLNKYVLRKKVSAARIIEIEQMNHHLYRLWFDDSSMGVSLAYMIRNKPKTGGYYIEDEFLGERFLPADEFEAEYTLQTFAEGLAKKDIVEADNGCK